jgi:hypothetical protein
MVGRYAKVITETGYYDEPRNPYGSGVDNITAAKLTLNLLLDAASQGVSRTFLYQLRSAYPDPGDTNTDVEYGLFRKDNSPKPMAVAIHNLTTILADPGSDAATFARRHLHAAWVAGKRFRASAFQVQRPPRTHRLGRARYLV